MSKGVRFDKISCLCILHSDVYYIVNLMRISTPFFIKVAQRQVQKESLSKRTQYDCLHGKSNAEVLKTIESADIVVDQLIIGWHGIFAIEAMAFGKPVIARTREDLRKAYEEMGCLDKGEVPMIDASPTTIYDDLKNLLEHPETWKEIGEKSRAYVEKHHSIEVIGKYFDKINRNTGITPKRERMVQLE